MDRETRSPIPLRVGDAVFEFQRDEKDLALFAALGSALAQIQSFEFQLSYQLGLLTRQDPQEFWSRTLGSLVCEFRRQLPDENLAQRLELARDRRNHLVHGILREYRWPMMSESAYLSAIQEIESTRMLLEEVAVEVSRALSDKSLLRLVVVSLDPDTGAVRREV